MGVNAEMCKRNYCCWGDSHVACLPYIKYTVGTMPAPAESQHRNPPLVTSRETSRRIAPWRNIRIIAPAVAPLLLIPTACATDSGGVQRGTTDKTASASSLQTAEHAKTLCSGADKPHKLAVENGAPTDKSTADRVVVTFLADKVYSDPAYPGTSLRMTISPTQAPPVYDRVASIQTAPATEAGGLVDVTKRDPALRTSHPATGIKPGDTYTVFAAGGETEDGSMSARTYTVHIKADGPTTADSLDVGFEGCTPLGAALASYRETASKT